MDVYLIWLLGFGVFFLFATSLILIHNRSHFLGLADLNSSATLSAPELNGETTSEPDWVSILIPARNEESNLPKLLNSLGKQDRPRLDIHILDDQSEDSTREIAEEFRDAMKSRMRDDPSSDIHVTVHSSLERPEGWLGKNWACQQLAGHARGDIYIFLDADTWLASNAITSIMEGVHRFELDFATVWPHQIMESLLEKTVVSSVYATVAAYLPTRYSYQAPAWIPFRNLRQKVKPMFASACGQCMIFKRDTYREIGGHKPVKDQVVEDVMLAKMVVRKGKTMRMFHGTDRLWCRMYRSPSEIFNGFRKNFFAGFNYNTPLFVLAWLLHFTVYVLPALVLIATLAGILEPNDKPLIASLSGLVVLTALIQRLWISKFYNWSFLAGFMYLPGILWFHMLAFVVIYDRLLKSGPTWKGRPV
ncbi:MAG: glycosyltransferase [Balneolaceae bacterium]|nr:MAG: glycosyltransferase [Balneolaceae bacterium]